MFASCTKQRSALVAIVAVAFCQQLATAQDRSDDDLALLQLKHTANCGAAPELEGKSVDSWIEGTKGVLVIAIPNMACTASVGNALFNRGVDFKTLDMPDGFTYQKGESPVWDWLHCTYPDDKSNGMIMHSYVFVDGEFEGNGFVATKKINSGELDDKLPKSKGTCEDKFPNEAKILDSYMTNSSNHVLLFGWQMCPCVGIATQRFVDFQVCYEGRQWADPSASLMKYFQCREKEPDSHSFIYFKSESGDWEYQGNGFRLAKEEVSDEELSKRLAASHADLTCKYPNVMINVYGTQLQECQVGNDYAGSWQSDGTCSEQTGGIHQICIEALPKDFSSETHQSAWSEERRGLRHCVCVGAWSLYMTDGYKHSEGADEIMPHCASIPETSLSPSYLGHWRDWNGYPAEVLVGISQLVLRCLKGTDSTKDKCGLKTRFDKLRASPEAKELKDADQLAPVLKEFAKLSCPEEKEASFLQYGQKKTSCH